MNCDKEEHNDYLSDCVFCAIENSAKYEQERIIKLLEDYDFSTIWQQIAWNPDAWEGFNADKLVAVIKDNK